MIDFIKTRDVKDPIRNVKENAGIDFFIPEKTEELVNEILEFNKDIAIVDNKIYIPPHSDILIPAGIKSKFDQNLALISANKSGIATKKKLIYGAEVIDSGYQGEWHFHLINWSSESQIIEFGQKIIQFLPVVISNELHNICNCSEEEFFTVKTERGEGGFGSSGV